MAKTCKVCGKRAYSNYCVQHKPKKPLKKTKYLKRIGKVGRQWAQTRKEWIQKNLPDKGYWECRYCGKKLTIDKLTLDHKLSRSRRPDLRFEHDNLVPACWECNNQKGSLSEDEFYGGS